MVNKRKFFCVNKKCIRVIFTETFNFYRPAEQEFSVETVVKKHLEIYNALLGAH
jgi:hypothetical protein